MIRFDIQVARPDLSGETYIGADTLEESKAKVVAWFDECVAEEWDGDPLTQPAMGEWEPEIEGSFWKCALTNLPYHYAMIFLVDHGTDEDRALITREWTQMHAVLWVLPDNPGGFPCGVYLFCPEGFHAYLLGELPEIVANNVADAQLWVEAELTRRGA